MQSRHILKPNPTSRTIKQHDSPLRFRKERSCAALLILCVAALLAVINPNVLFAQDCFVSAQSEVFSTQHIQLDVTCPNAPFFKLSESPDFKESAETGVAVMIDYIDPLGQYADVSIR